MEKKIDLQAYGNEWQKTILTIRARRTKEMYDAIGEGNADKEQFYKGGVDALNSVVRRLKQIKEWK